jgi:DNA-binding XRE family transcriptional regulator
MQTGDCARFSRLYDDLGIVRVTKQKQLIHPMPENQNEHQNRLDYYRRRMRFSTAQVAHLLGHQDTSSFWDYEVGRRLPNLTNAFRLSIILRVPVEFIFGGLYDNLRHEIRAKEERLSESSRQQVLF